MTQYLESYKKNIAIALRKKGSSLSEIKTSLGVPKSTLSHWLKNIVLTKEQKKVLKDKRSSVARKNSEKRVLKTSKMIEEIKSASAKNIQKISARELWLMGIILYWRQKANSDLKKGIHFSSSNPQLIKLFLKWLNEIGKITDEEILFDIFIGKNKKNNIADAIAYWAKATSFSKEMFQHIYYQNGSSKSSQAGFLRIRVKASSMLARQISGWINGIQKSFWGNFE